VTARKLLIDVGLVLAVALATIFSALASAAASVALAP
jgi:hypothetical protein